MRVHLRFLRDSELSRKALKNSEWQLEGDGDDGVWAVHPQVRDESAARSHLHEAGLLTASSVSIEFVQRVTGRPAASTKTRKPSSFDEAQWLVHLQ
jgi:hypothetical protein